MDDQIYVGSTCLLLPKRLYAHKLRAQSHPNTHVSRQLNSIGWNNVHIVLLESYPCNSKIELYQRERYHYDLIKPSLNLRKPFVSDEEYKVIQKIYRTDHQQDSDHTVRNTSTTN